MPEQATLFDRRIHFARLENSPRLKRLLKFLKDHKPHSTLAIVKGAKICAVNSAVDELRENGYDIPCTRKGDIWEYQLIK